MSDPGCGRAGGRPLEAAHKREARLLDQAISMQAALRDWYRAAGTALVVFVLLLSVTGLAFAFAGGDDNVTLLGTTARRATWLGWLAVVTFSLTLVELVLDPRGASRWRAEAVRAMAALKNEYRAAANNDADEDARQRLSERFREVTGSAPEIPNVLFNPLKGAHLRKVEISRILSDNPGMAARRARRLLKRRLP